MHESMRVSRFIFMTFNLSIKDICPKKKSKFAVLMKCDWTLTSVFSRNLLKLTSANVPFPVINSDAGNNLSISLKTDEIKILFCWYWQMLNKFPDDIRTLSRNYLTMNRHTPYQKWFCRVRHSKISPFICPLSSYVKRVITSRLRTIKNLHFWGLYFVDGEKRSS